MSREELIDKMMMQIMEDFDFDRVHSVMVNLDWKWATGDGEMIVPSTYQLIKHAERLLRLVARFYGDKEPCSSEGGGFVAHLDGETLTLQFVLSKLTSFASDFIEVDGHDPFMEKGVYLLNDE